jgi:hypothetical protein
VRRLLAVLAAALVAAVPAGAASQVWLDVAGSRPLVVRGGGFRAGEQVLVRATVAHASGVERTVRASRGGGFVLRFPTVVLPRCRGYVVRATGSLGTRAVVRELPECPDVG